jgi:hypothetical protein
MHPDRYVKITLWIFLGVSAVFLLSLPLFPFIDLPNHLAEATIYKFHDAPGNIIGRYYSPTPWYFPNTFHPVFCSIFPDVETGNRIFHILTIILMQVSLYLVIRHLNGNPWYGLLGILFTFNYNMTFGFVGFAISIPTIILLFYVILLDIRAGSVGLKLLISFLLVLLFLMHAQNALFGLLLYGLMTLYTFRKSFGKLVVRGLLIPMPLILLIFAWWFTRGTAEEESTTGYLMDYYSSAYFREFLMRFRIVVFDNFQLYDGVAGLAIAAFFFICVFVPIFWLRPWRQRNLRSFYSDANIYALIFFFSALGCYLFLPDKLPGQTPLFQRFCTIVMLSFIILASVVVGQVRTGMLRYFVVGIVVVYSCVWFEYLFTFNRVNGNFNREFFSGTDHEGRLAGLIYENKYRGRKVYIHYPNFFLIWNHGIVSSKIIDYRFGVVRRVAPESELPFYHELIGEGYKPQPAYNRLEYLLVRGQAPVSPDLNLQQFELVRETGPWKLYKQGEQ